MIMNPKNENGTILVAAVGTASVVALLVSVSMGLTMNTSRIADRSQDLAPIRAATEGALEHAYGIWRTRLMQKGRALSSEEVNAGVVAPVFSGLHYTTGKANGALTISAMNPFGGLVDGAARQVVDVPGYKGWRGLSYAYVASVRLGHDGRSATPLEYGVRRQFVYTQVPLFQAMFFFENDIELYRSNTMNVTGLVHTNGSGFVSNAVNEGLNVTFQNFVSSVGVWTHKTIPYKSENWSGYAANSNQDVNYSKGKESQVSQVGRLEPLGRAPASVLDAAPTGPLSPSGRLIGPDGDSDGNPNNDSLRELIEPPSTEFPDPPEIAQRRLYNKAGVIITVDSGKITIKEQNGTKIPDGQVDKLKAAISTASIYDQREQTSVRVSTLDVGTALPSLTSLSSFNGVLYIHDVTPTSKGSPKNAIRLKNGGSLPRGGLTVASQNGIYIQGDYNTGTGADPKVVPANALGNAGNTASSTAPGYEKKPSAVIGDAVMILSNSWNDANASLDITARAASNTTVNTAMLGGFMPSGFTPASGTQYGFSGGVNNYPRFLERWSGKYFTYFGSMVELFQSTSFTGRWDTANIYSPPIRSWNFDTSFIENPPPGSLDAVAMTRGAWTRY